MAFGDPVAFGRRVGDVKQNEDDRAKSDRYEQREPEEAT